jgi:hypothetical protein
MGNLVGVTFITSQQPPGRPARTDLTHPGDLRVTFTNPRPSSLSQPLNALNAISSRAGGHDRPRFGPLAPVLAFPAVLVPAGGLPAPSLLPRSRPARRQVAVATVIESGF